MNIGEVQSLINYYARSGYWRHIQTVCKEVLKKKGNEPTIMFWRAVATAMEGSHSDAIRELESIVGKKEVALAATSALLQTHKSMKLQDKDAIANLKKQLKEVSKTILADSPNDARALTVTGWLQLSSGNPRHEKKALQYFEKALAAPPAPVVAAAGPPAAGQPAPAPVVANKKEIDALLGTAAYFERIRKFDSALENLNQIIVLYSWFLPALTEKAKILMMSGSWEESLETSHRVLNSDTHNIDAVRIITLYLLARESRPAVASHKITDLIEAIDRHEPKNAKLYYDVARTCARLAARKKSVLEPTLTLMDRALKLEPENSLYLTEMAYHYSLLGEYERALKLYHDAAQLDESNVGALHGMIKCKMCVGSLADAEQHLEFLGEIQAQATNAQLLLLQAQMAWRKDKNEAKSLATLNEAASQHFEQMKTVNAGLDYFVIYNPEFLLELADEFAQHVSTEPMHPSDPPSPVLDAMLNVLDSLTRQVPGMIDAQLLFAKYKFVSGDYEAADRALNNCFKLDSQFADAYVLQAQKCLVQENYRQAASALEQALSLKFDVRNTPMYHLIKSKLNEASGQFEEGLKLVEAAINLPGVRRPQKGAPDLPVQERISIFLQIGNLHTKLNHFPEAAKIMSEARNEFKDTSDSVRVVIADAELALKRNDVEAAIGLLRGVPGESVYYTRARILLADIYLKNKKNKRLYSACYHDLATKNNNVHGYILLGEAYMRIQQPERAIAAYESALKLNPSDPALSSKIGRALVTTHDFTRAVEYYETAARGDPSKVHLYHELAELYLQLGKYTEAERVLDEALRRPNRQADDVTTMIADVKSHLLSAKIRQCTNAPEKLKEALTNAWNLQKQVLQILRDPDLVRKQKEVAATIAYNLAQYFDVNEDYENAQRFYNEALKQNDAHEQSILALAKIHLRQNDLDACQHQCVTLMRIDPSNEDASMMLADLMFQKNEHEAATYHFQQLLERKPTHYVALNKLVQLLRRAGRLTDAPRFLKLAQKSSPRAEFDPGFHYCKGLHAWYTSQPREALQEFNQARKDPTWGESALVNMIDIYLNPDNEALFGEAAEAKGDNSEHIRAAEILLKELAQITSEQSLQYIVLSCYAQMATNNKVKIENAQKTLMNVIQQNRDYVPGLLGTANAFMLLGQPPKARNQLKRIAKMQLIPAFANEFEKSWLMLSDTFIQAGKYDLAQELCKRVLANNKSSAKAWEQLGLIMEKERSYKDAADNYEKAWKFQNESSPSVGFKLAFNYLKAKRYVEAIDVCHKVLAQYPDYPKIHKEILEKSRQSLRP